MNKPKLTIGFATHTDFYGAEKTLTALRMHHAEVMPLVEIVVVDNAYSKDPSSHSVALRRYLEGVADGIGIDWKGEVLHSGGASLRQSTARLLTENHPAGLQYVALGAQGTTQSRQKIFDVANGDYVLCCDSHVDFWPGAIESLIEFYDEQLDLTVEGDLSSGCLLQGPLLHDNMQTLGTHFDDVIRGNMWGVWGYDDRGFDLSAPPFEIPAQGLGVFSCRKESWPGFNPLFRGFGGEEFYIHEKFRKLGRKSLCLPFLRWQHRFDRPDGLRYTNDMRHRVRNYLLGYKELELPIDRLRKYFRDGKPEHPDDDPNRSRVSRVDWETLCLDLELEP